MQNQGRGPISGVLLVAGVALLIGVLAVLLIVAPPPTTSGPIYTDTPPANSGRPADFGSVFLLLPLSIASVLLVAAGTFLVPALIRRREAGNLDAGDAFAAAGRLGSRLAASRRLALFRTLAITGGALLSLATMASLVPTLIAQLAEGRPRPSTTPTPAPLDPVGPGGAVDGVTLIALGAIGLIALGVLAALIPALRSRLRLRHRPGRAQQARAFDPSASQPYEPAPFEAPTDPTATGLPPELAALLPPTPRIPSRLERGGARLVAALTRLAIAIVLLPGRVLRGTVRLGVAVVRAVARGIGTLIRGVARGIAALVRAIGRAIVAVVRGIVAGVRGIGRAIVAVVRGIGLGIVAVMRLVIAAVVWLVREAVWYVTTVVTGTAALVVAVARGFVAASAAILRGAVRLVHAIGRALLLLVTTILAVIYWVLVAIGFVIVAGITGLITGTYELIVWSVVTTARALVVIVLLPVRATRAIGRRLLDLAVALDAIVARVGSRFDGRRPAAKRRAMAHPTTVLVVALAPQSGKSTVAAEAARLLDTTWINSSAVIAERLEVRLGLPTGRIAETRKVDHEAYRPALIEEGNWMAAEGTSPGVECVRRGYRVIDGIRRRDELEAAIAEIRARGGRSLVICVRRPNAPAPADNTEADALEALADVTIANDGGLTRLRRRTATALRRHGAL